MTKNGALKTDLQAMTIQKILITQPKPESDKSPYFELSKKFDLELDFHPFIRLEGIHARDFRKQKIDIQNYTAVIFTSRNAIDHFFSGMRRNENQCFAGYQVFLYNRSGSTLSPKIHSLQKKKGFLRSR